jgi:hypothetical protein
VRIMIRVSASVELQRKKSEGKMLQHVESEKGVSSPSRIFRLSVLVLCQHFFQRYIQKLLHLPRFQGNFAAVEPKTQKMTMKNTFGLAPTTGREHTRTNHAAFSCAINVGDMEK